MQAVIVAAGQGRRLQPVISDRPKALLELQGASLISRSLALLRGHGIEDIAVVVGYHQEQISSHLQGQPVTYLYNPFYGFTNNMASLWFAQGFVRGDFLYLHGDLIFEPQLLAQLVHSDHPDALLVEEKVCDEEDMKVSVNAGRLVASSKELAAEETFGEWTGLARFSASLAGALMEQIGALLEAGRRPAYDTEAFTALAGAGHELAIESFTGIPWAEIDTPEDLEAARRLFPEGG